MVLLPAAPPAEITTVMFRQIPCRYTQGSLLREVDAAGFCGCYDFFYLPMDTKNKTSVGYAFINFLHAADAKRFMTEMQGHRFQRHPSDKVGVVSAAHVQGLRRNVEHFARSAVLRARDVKCRPIVLQQGFKRNFLELLAEFEVPPAALNPDAVDFVPGASQHCDSQPLPTATVGIDSAPRKVVAEVAAPRLKICSRKKSSETSKLSSWVEDAFAMLVEELAPLPKAVQGSASDVGGSWISDALHALALGPTIPPSRRRRSASPSTRTRSTWVADAFVALTSSLVQTPREYCKLGLELSEALSDGGSPLKLRLGPLGLLSPHSDTEGPSSQRSTPRRMASQGVGDALHRLRDMGGWAWVAFAGN